jgi:uncharacterized repeat protein (TIGR01451 family)
MRIAISRVILFAAGLALLLAALLPSLAGPVGAAPPMLITETTTAEPPTRTATAVPPTSTNATVPTSTPVAPSEPSSTPTDVPRDSRKKTPTSTPAPTITPTSVPQIADPAITKSVNRGTVKVGDTVEYTISVTNLGNATATNVVVEDSLPSFLSLSGASATRGDVSVSGSTVRVVIGDLAPGETVTVTITARVVKTATPPSNSNIATLSTDSLTDDPGNNSSSVSLTTEEAPSPTAALPAILPTTGASGGPSLLLLAALGLALIAASLFALRRTSASR